MGLPVERPRRATYADLEAVPPHKVAEILNGVLHVFPRPAPRHATTSSRIGVKLGGPFDLGDGGPGGWWLLDEPELHFGSKAAPDVVVPDLAGWRRERMPKLPREAHFTLAPDWVCEILSPSTEKTDRIEKMPIYAREGVQYAWLIHPVRRTLEAFRLNADGFWVLIGMHEGNSRVRVEPFDAVELDLSVLWVDIEGEEPEETPAAAPSSPRTRKARRAAPAKAKPKKRKT